MRRFKLKSDNFDHLPLIKGEVYPEDYHPDNWDQNVLWNAENNPGAWEEVFEEPQVFNRVRFNEKTLHKDTDLGMFTLGIINGTISNQLMVDSMSEQAMSFLVENSIKLAKELIKQLDQETK